MREMVQHSVAVWALGAGVAIAAVAPAQLAQAQARPAAAARAQPQAPVAADVRRRQQAFDAAMLAHARTLAARGDARSLLAAALIVPLRGGPASGRSSSSMAKRQAWFDQALAARPADPLVAWLYAVDCPLGESPCDRKAAIAQLLRVDGDNAAVQLLAMDVALNAGQRAAARTHLRLAARATRFHPYSDDALALMLDARSAAPLPPMSAERARALGESFRLGRPATNSDLVAVHSMARWAASGVPALHGIVELCQLDEPAPERDAALRQDCADTLALLANSEASPIYPMLALPSLIESSDGAEQAAWQARLRELTWLFERALPLTADPSAGVEPAVYAGWIAEFGELEAMRKLMQHNDLSPTPPADWLPRHPRYRALITTGHAPAG